MSFNLDQQLTYHFIVFLANLLLHHQFREIEEVKVVFVERTIGLDPRIALLHHIDLPLVLLRFAFNQVS